MHKQQQPDTLVQGAKTVDVPLLHIQYREHDKETSKVANTCD